MKEKLKKKLRSKVWLLKAMATSQASAWADFVTSFVVFAWLGFGGGDAAAAGAIAGGVVNCTLNYKWTFRGNHCPVANVVIKYFMVWVGSLLLNSYGTEYLTDLFLGSDLLTAWGISRNLRFTVARLAVSLIVSLFWNLLLQRTFVYRYVRFDNLLSIVTFRQRASRKKSAE